VGASGRNGTGIRKDTRKVKTELMFEVREYPADSNTSFHIGDYETEKEARDVANRFLAKYLPINNGYRVEVSSFHKKDS
jgi:hypothetical protein